MSVAADLAGVQAQVLSSAELVLGIRSSDAAPDTVRSALWDDRALVKTWAMRGTLHLLPALELGLWTTVLSTWERRYTAGWEAYHGITRDELRAVTDAVGEVLPGRCLTREELAADVARRLGSPHLEERLRSGWGALLKPAAWRGLLCFGPDRGRNVTFVSPREWLGTERLQPAPDPEAARGAVLQRFLDAHGPATSVDFARWFGTEPAAARRLFTHHAEHLAAVDLAGSRAWLTRQAAADIADAAAARDVRLLPGFDPYVLAPVSHRAHVIPDGFLSRVSRTAGWISPVLLVGGRIAGVWRHERQQGTVAVTVEPFASTTATVRAAAEAHAQEYGRLLGGPVEVRWEKP